MQTKIKKSSKLTKKITHADDTQPCNISFPNSTSFVRYKNNKFLTNHLTTFWFEICYFYILQTKSSLDKIFYKIVYYHIICMCDFFGKFRRLFYRSLHGFSQQAGFHSIRCLPNIPSSHSVSSSAALLVRAPVQTHQPKRNHFHLAKNQTP